MSSREMTINQIKTADKNFGSNHTIKVSGFEDRRGKSKLDLILERLDKIENRLNKIEQLDNFVLDQFKKHGWIK